MPTFRDGSKWRYRVMVTLPSGKRVRISGTPATNTKAAAELAQAEAIARTITEGPRMGRPLVAGEVRDRVAKARVSESEERDWMRLARAHGCETISDVIRLAMSRLAEEG